MIELKVGEHDCKIPQSWSEMKLGEWNAIYEIMKQNEFVSPYDNDAVLTDDEKKLVDRQRDLHNIVVNRKVFSKMTGIDEKTIDRVDAKQMSETLNTMTNFLNSEVERKTINADHKHSFTFKGIKYYFPIAEMRESTFGDFIEAAQLDLLSEKNKIGRFGVIAEQMAILCREQNEEYDENKVAKKTRLFKDLTMDVVWDFIFFLNQQISIYKTNTQMFSKMESETKTDTQPQIGKL